MGPIPVYLEQGRSRTFAVTLDWPGWARSGKGDEGALDALAAYAVRFLPVARRTGLPVDFAPDDVTFEVVERVAGTRTTDFGAIDAVLGRDADPVTDAEGERLARCVEAAWAELDEVAARTSAELVRGPRGGGRDRDPMLAHVLGAEQSYARKIGVAHKTPDIGDEPAIAAMRADIAAVLRRPWQGEDLGLGRGRSWPPRYAARRIAWHVLDHAWEMQDKDLSGR